MRKVIICEDDPFNALDLADAVEAGGDEVIACFANGADALRVAPGLKPDIALVDLNLADGVSGASVAVKLAQMGCAVIVVTGDNHVPLALHTVQHIQLSKPVASSVVEHVMSSIPFRSASVEETVAP